MAQLLTAGLIQPFVIACIEAGRWNDMEFFIGKCVTETDLEKLKDLRGRNPKEIVARALDRHFVESSSKNSKGR